MSDEKPGCLGYTVLLTLFFSVVVLPFLDDGSSGGSPIPRDKIIGVKEVSQGGDLGLIGTKNGPKGFMTAKQKKFEVTYEDEDGVIRTRTMSSDPTK
jgi:hypothetical protein